MDGQNDAATSEPVLEDDLLRGIKQIAGFLKINTRRAYYLCENKKIPVGKEGKNTWIGSRRVLEAHYRRLTSGE